MIAALKFRLLAVLLMVLLAGPCLAHKLTLAVAKGSVSLLVYVADSQGYFQAEGLQLQLLECSSGRSCVQELLKGHADVATAAELPVVLANSRGENLAILSTMSQQLRWTGRSGQHNPMDWVDPAALRALAPRAVTLP